MTDTTTEKRELLEEHIVTASMTGLVLQSLELGKEDGAKVLGAFLATALLNPSGHWKDPLLYTLAEMATNIMDDGHSIVFDNKRKSPIKEALKRRKDLGATFDHLKAEAKAEGAEAVLKRRLSEIFG